MGRSRDLADLGDLSVSTLKVDTITDTSGGNTTSINSTTPTANTNVGKNRIINGAMDIWQRGTSGTSIGTSVYGPDRWRNYGGNALTLTSSTTYGNPKSLLIQANNTNHGIGQRIESFNIADLAGQTVTLSYKIRADNAGTHNLLMFYPAGTDNWSSETPFVNTSKSYTNNVVTTITHTVTLPAQAANGISVMFQWYNGGAAINLTAFIWDIQLELGSQATQFEHRPYGTELALCQRYFQVHSDTTNIALPTAVATASTALNLSLALPVTMRASPSLYSTLSSTGKFRANTNIDRDTDNNPSLGNASGSIVNLNFDGWSGFTIGYAAAIRRYTATGVLGFNAEL